MCQKSYSLIKYLQNCIFLSFNNISQNLYFLLAKNLAEYFFKFWHKILHFLNQWLINVKY